MKSYVVEKELVLHNLALLQKKAGDTPIWAVLKGDGYGLGIRPMAQLCHEGGIDRFAVTEPEEARALRELFPDCKILMLRPTADPAELEQVNLRLQRKYETIAANETRCEEYMTEDADIIIAAYGTTARIAKKSIKELRARGIKAGLLRPITLWPFPSEYFAKACGHAKCMLTVEMSRGQMVEDVRLAVNGRVPVDFYGRVGGMVPSWREIMEAAEKTLKGGKD